MFLRMIKMLALVGLFIGTRSACALEFRPMQENDLRYVVISGPFNVSEDLTPFMTSVTSIDARFVSFDSPGGDVATSLRLGRMIRALQLNTLQLRRMECASACSLAFIGGVQRFAEPGSIGVHRSSFDSSSVVGRDEAVSQIQIGTGEILSYLREMGVDSEFLEIALKYDRSDIRYLSLSEMQALLVVTETEQAPKEQTARAQPEPDRNLEKQALDFVRALIEENGDNPTGALASVLAYYAPTISYYGKSTTLSAVMSDKQAYFNRWPERGYRIRGESVLVTCNQTICTVSGVYDWMVRSLPRNKQAKGAARFSYSISLGSTPKVVSEEGQVMR